MGWPLRLVHVHVKNVGVVRFLFVCGRFVTIMHKILWKQKFNYPSQKKTLMTTFSLLFWQVGRGMFQGQTHRAVRYLAILPVGDDLMGG